MVEDEAIIAMDIESLLKRLGYAVIGSVNSGEAAIESVREIKPDLILMDIILKGKIDGIEAAREIMKHHDVPVIYLTANADLATVSRARDTASYGYITKPINQYNVTANIDTALYKHELQKKLKESEERYRLLAENSSDLICLHDPDNTFRFVSPSCRDMTGYEPEELIGKKPYDFFHPDDQLQVWAQAYRAVKSEGKPPSIQYRFRKKDGTYIWMEMLTKHIFDDAGNLLMFETSSRDITMRKVAEESLSRANKELSDLYEEMAAANEELRVEIDERLRTEERLIQSESRFKILFETMAEGIIYHDAQGKIIDANPAALRILGLSYEEIMRRTSFDPRWMAIREDGSPFPGDEHPAMLALRTGKAIKGTLMGVFHPKEEVFRWIHVNAMPLFKEDEETPYEVYSTFEDITDYKNAQEIIKTTERRFSSLFNAMSEGVAIHKALYDHPGGQMTDYQILEVNPRFEEIIGIKKEKILNKTSREAYGTSYAPYLTEYATALKTGNPMRFEAYFEPMKKKFTISVAPLSPESFATIFFTLEEK
ncbi:MAG TPA: PAS domain S-box protein [Spirochaetia bacterium]|nr:PAS domain S-box protein [Spirochaetia bacterium]